MFRQKMTGKQKAFGQLRAIVPAVGRDLEDGLQKSAEELAGMAANLAPKKTGDYARTIRAKPLDRADGVPAWGVFADWIWRFIEHGTAPSTIGQRITNSAGKTRRAGRSHPGTPPRPHLFPAYRALKKRIRSRTSRSINKAVRQSTSG